MSISETLGLVAIAISVLSATGVYLSPIINSWLIKKSSDRESHKRDLIKHALNPLIRGIETFLYREFDLSPIGYMVPDNDMLKRYKSRVFDFIASIPSPANPDDWYDGSLYQDYQNHNKDLYYKIEAARKSLKEDMPIYVEKRWNLIIELSKRFDESVSIYIQGVRNKTGIIGVGEESELKMKAIVIAMMKLLDYSNPNLPPLEYQFSKEKSAILDLVNGTIESSDIQSLAQDLHESENNIRQYLTDTRNRIFEEATTGKRLVGNCHRLCG